MIHSEIIFRWRENPPRDYRGFSRHGVSADCEAILRKPFHSAALIAAIRLRACSRGPGRWMQTRVPFPAWIRSAIRRRAVRPASARSTGRGPGPFMPSCISGELCSNGWQTRADFFHAHAAAAVLDDNVVRRRLPPTARTAMRPPSGVNLTAFSAGCRQSGAAARDRRRRGRRPARRSRSPHAWLPPAREWLRRPRPGSAPDRSRGRSASTWPGVEARHFQHVADDAMKIFAGLADVIGVFHDSADCRCRRNTAAPSLPRNR